MTRKQELIDFITEKISEEQELIAVERIHEIPYESFMTKNATIKAYMGICNIDIIDHINNTYNDDLFTTSSKGLVKEILFWYI